MSRPDCVIAPASANVLQAGVTGGGAHHRHRPIFPGQITAQVTEIFMTARLARSCSFRQGNTRIIGQYDNGVGFWAGSVASCLSGTGWIFRMAARSCWSQPGADAEGCAGLEMVLDYHQ